MTQRAQTLKGFTPEFLAQFAEEEQRAANRLQAEAALRQRRADGARKELKRRKGAADAARNIANKEQSE